MLLNPQTNRSLSEFSTFGIGGAIRFFLEIRTEEEAKWAYLWAGERDLPVRVIGKGSNSLFSDAPFEGLVLLNKIDHSAIDGCVVTVGAGANFSYLGVQTAKLGLAGLEFASGIPATVGGAIWMNAGANGGETADCLESVRFLFKDGHLQEFSRSQLTFGYRTSCFQSMEGCILGARFHLHANSEARQNQLRIVEYRIKTQPLGDKSAGCVFRNPSKELSAGALIDRCGLKGLRVGDAQVSEVHANFIVNVGQAKARDVLALIHLVQVRVLEQTSIQLEPELRIW